MSGKTHGAGDRVYLISQAENGCLAVVRGSNPKDAVIGLASVDTCKEKQWFNCDGQWQWGGDRSFCLAPVPGKPIVGLAECCSSSAKWNLDAEGRMAIGRPMLTVPPGGSMMRVILCPKMNLKHQMWWTDAELKAVLDDSEPAVYPLSAEDKTTYEREIAKGLLNQIAPLDCPLPFPRDVGPFPGSVDQATPRVTKTVALNLSVLGQAPNLRMTTPQDWQATDLYVAAGDIFQVALPESLSPEQAQQIHVRIGAHTDRLLLTSLNVKNNFFRRMPIVSESFAVSPGVNSFRSQFGGNVIFVFEEGERFTVDVEVSNVVEAPYFRAGKTTADEWAISRVLDAPHAVLESEKVVLVVRRSDVMNISLPEGLMNRYDFVVEKLNFLAGFCKGDLPPRGKHWLVNDHQIKGGSAHAGFPLMFDRNYYNLASLDMPHQWCVWHELGHNYQQGIYWANTFGAESTVNLFSLYIQEQLFGEDRLKEQGDYQKAVDAVDKGFNFQDCNSWQKLVFLMEIKHAFPEQGWEMFRQLHQRTRALSESEAERLSSSTQLQYDFVYKSLSESVQQDLILTFTRWGFNISVQAVDEIQSLGLEIAPADLALRD